MTNTIRAAGRLLAADVDGRRLSYLLLPYGEAGRTNKGTLTASAGSVELPDKIVANMEHDRTRPVGVSVELVEAADGVRASFDIAPTTAGDDLLVEARMGLRPGVSVEIDAPVIRGGKLLAGKLSGAGFVAQPAFPSALLVAADAGDLPDELPPDTTSETVSTDEVVIDGVTYVRKTTSTYVTETAPKTAAGDPAVDEDDNQEDPPVNASTHAAAPDGLRAATAKTGSDLTLHDIARVLATASRTGDGSLLAALTDIKYDGTGGIAGPMVQPQFVELWSGKAYQRRIVPLFSHADLTGIKIAGWRWLTKPKVAPWAGNKTNVPSGTAGTELAEATAQRLAGAHDIGREFRDFDVPGFWESYFRAMTESYAVESDADVAAKIIAGASAVTSGTVPTGASAGLTKVVDGALAMVDVAAPSFALLAPDLWRDVLLTPKDKSLEYLSSALGIEEGSLSGFRLIPWSGLAAGSVLVGAREAATVHELPGDPIRVEGLDMVKGGIDAGLFGYVGTVIHDARALQLVDGAAPVGG